MTSMPLSHDPQDTPSPSPRRGRRAAEAAQCTRQELLDAALEVFSDRSYNGVSIRDVAETAGTAHGLVRHHFGNKDDLWKAAVDHAIDRCHTALEGYYHEVHEGPDPVATARGVLTTFLRVCAQHPHIIRLILHEGTLGGERLDYALSRFSELGVHLEPLLARVQGFGLLHGYTDQQFFLTIMLNGAGPFALPALTDWVTGEDVRREDVTRRFIDFFVTSLLGEQQES